MAKQKTIQFLKPYGMQPKGAILTVDVPVADLLIQSKRAVEVEAKPAEQKSKLPLKRRAEV